MQKQSDLAPGRDRPAYDPKNLCREDEEARQFDDNSEGIDWDEILATTQDDLLARRFVFNSADYTSQEDANAALEAWLDTVFGERKA